MEDYFNEYEKLRNVNARREQLKALLTTIALPTARRKARALQAQSQPIKLHLGCGDTYLEGWCNIDLARPGRKLDLKWDLRRPLPFDDCSVEAIFSEHLFEHIPYPGAFNLMIECHRMLQAGGILRVGVPDLGRYMNAYFGNDDIIEMVRPGRPTRAMALAENFFFYGHRSVYDSVTLCTMLEGAGFSSAGQSTYGMGKLDPQPDSSNRAIETLYVEAVK